jgi:rubrerythrin
MEEIEKLRKLQEAAQRRMGEGPKELGKRLIRLKKAEMCENCHYTGKKIERTEDGLVAVICPSCGYTWFRVS